MLTLGPITLTEGITNVARDADTDRNMVPHITLGVDSTQTRTRILTFARETGPVGRTVGVNHTLRSTVGC